MRRQEDSKKMKYINLDFMYHVAIISEKKKAVITALKLLQKLPSLSISVVEPYCREYKQPELVSNIPDRVAILPECASVLYIKRDCLELENKDFLYFDFLVIDLDTVDQLNFAE